MLDTPEAQHRTNNKRLTWTGPLLMMIARPGFAIAAQAAVAAVFHFRGRAKPWVSAAPWWIVYGTLIDVGCLFALTRLMRREGGTLYELVGLQPGRLRRDILLGLAYALGILPFGILGGIIGTALIYGSAPAPVPMGPLPLSGALYGLLIWPAVWAVAEELTYLGYALPRLEALTGRKWIALLVVVFFWTVQHCAMPLRPDLSFLLWRSITPFPAILMVSLIFIRTRRLLPLMVAHWVANAASVLVLVVLPLLRPVNLWRP
jgi:membrane protease YdiL (CAAX protease family)